MASNYLTTRDAATALGVSVRTIQQWFDAGRLCGWTTESGHRRISPSSVQQALHKRAGGKVAALPLSILIIEDEPSLILLYRTRIARWQFPTIVNTAPNGYEGLVLAGETQPQLLLCDLRLPGVNGFQIVRALREMPRYRRMAIVVVTGLDAVEVEAHGGLPPNVEVMVKPIDFERLLEIAKQIPVGVKSVGGMRHLAQ